MVNILSIDIEDYWCILQRDWLNILDAKPTEAVLKNTRWCLQVFNDYKAKATFFVLGEVAQSFPHLIKEISDEGHEIAVHGFYHHQIFKLSRDEFKKEVSDAKNLLEDLSGQKVIGHRAPAFSINKDTKWALEVLAELGFNYDSSISPMAGKCNGWPRFKKEIHKIPLAGGQSIIEVPMSTISFLGIRELGIGGGYMRHLPYIYTKLAIKHVQKKCPAIIYMHPYEIDEKLMQVSFNNLLEEKDKKAALHFHKYQLRNRHTVKKKLNKLLQDFKFTTIDALLKDIRY